MLLSIDIDVQFFEEMLVCNGNILCCIMIIYIFKATETHYCKCTIMKIESFIADSLMDSVLQSPVLRAACRIVS